MGLLPLMFFMFLLDSTVCSKISVQAPTCGNNTFFIQYPFKLVQEGQIPHHISPYDLKCNRQGVVALSLPFSGEFYVRNIDYFQQKIQLYDPSNCLPKRLKNLSLSSSPFMAVSYQKYTFFSCPLESLSSSNFTEVRCLRNSTASIVATSETSMMAEIKNLTVCKVSYSLQIPVSQDSEYVYNGIDGDLQLSWSDPSSRGDSRGKTSSKPGTLTIILICAVIVSTALLVSLFCIGCGLSIIVVMLDIEEANNETSWRCSTRVWEMARIRLSRAPRGAAAPLNEVSFVSSSSQQPPPSDQSSSTPPSTAAVHPFSYFLSPMPSPEVLRGAEAPLNEVQFMSPSSQQPPPSDQSASTPPRPSTAAVHPFSYFLSPMPSPGAPLNEVSFMSSSSTPPPPPLPPSIAAVHPFSDFFSPMTSPEVPRGAPAPLGVAAAAFMPSPEIPSMAAPHDDESFTVVAPPNESSAISSTQVPRGADESTPSGPSVISFMPTAHEDELFLDANPPDESSFITSLPQASVGAPAPLDESSSTPPPSLAQTYHSFDYYFSLLSAQFQRGAAAPLDEIISSAPRSPSVDDDDVFSVIPSPPHPGTYDEDGFSFDELPTEDIIIGGSECIFGPNGDSCIICLGEYKSGERLRLIRKCNHCFHADCLDQWLQRKSSCPICRTNVI